MVCGNTRLTITSFDFGSSHLRSAATGSSGGVGLKQCFFWAPLMSFWWNKETAKNVIHFPHPEKNTYLWVCWHIFGHLPTGYSANGIWLTRWEFTCKCCHLEALYLGEDERVCLTPWLCPEVCTTKWNFQIPMGDMSFFLRFFPIFRSVSLCPQNIIKLGSLASRGCETEKPKRMIRSLSDQVFECQTFL